jgi:hypothetical protein
MKERTVNNVKDCDSYNNIPSLQTYGSSFASIIVFILSNFCHLQPRGRSSSFGCIKEVKIYTSIPHTFSWRVLN